MGNSVDLTPERTASFASSIFQSLGYNHNSGSSFCFVYGFGLFFKIGYVVKSDKSK